MHEHLAVITVPVHDRETLGDVESQVLARIDPPFNLAKVDKTPLRSRLSELRRASNQQTNDSAIGRLLEEVSWEGSSVRGYRGGGRGRENVLTTEIWQLLHYLPRDDYLGSVLRDVDAQAGFPPLRLDVEATSVTVLPDEILLPHGQVVVQPDVELVAHDCYVLVEAKRIRRGSFQPLQLAREMVAAHHRAGGRRAVLLLVLGSPPPVKVKGHAVLVDPGDAVRQSLPAVCGDEELARRLSAAVDETICWTTWDRIQEIVSAASADYGTTPAELTVHRLAQDLIAAIDRHR